MQRSTGFTLMEAIAVLVLCSLILAIAIPHLAGMLRRYKMKTSISQLSAQIRIARYLAIQQKADYRILIEGTGLGNSENKYVTLKDPDGDGTYETVDGGAFTFPSGVELGSGSIGRIDINPRGACTAVPVGSTAISLQQQGEHGYRITIGPGCLISVSQS
jgi:type II secretory pathway pseudopilin PulG